MFFHISPALHETSFNESLHNVVYNLRFVRAVLCPAIRELPPDRVISQVTQTWKVNDETSPSCNLEEFIFGH